MANNVKLRQWICFYSYSYVTTSCEGLAAAVNFAVYFQCWLHNMHITSISHEKMIAAIG